MFFELNDDTKAILGRPNFMCAKLADCLRKLGHEIPTRAEEEQAHVIYWLLGKYEEHGADWREAAANELRQLESVLPKDSE